VTAFHVFAHSFEVDVETAPKKLQMGLVDSQRSEEIK
jgi:hypothetical protein